MSPTFGPKPLPQDTVRWGALVFRSDGLFNIDETAYAPQVDEFKSKLSDAKTALGWVNVFNKYTAFFLRSFGTCAEIFGMQHVDQICLHWQKIQRQVFYEHSGNALSALMAKFGLDILDMWAYWPMACGGLGMKNPVLQLGALKESLKLIKYPTFPTLKRKIGTCGKSKREERGSA